MISFKIIDLSYGGASGGGTHEEGVYNACGGMYSQRGGGGGVLTMRGYILELDEYALCVEGCGVLARRWVYIACGGGGTRAKRGLHCL